jgi:hypothetical protein
VYYFNKASNISTWTSPVPLTHRGIFVSICSFFIDPTQKYKPLDDMDFLEEENNENSLNNKAPVKSSLMLHPVIASALDSKCLFLFDSNSLSSPIVLFFFFFFLCGLFI